MQVYPLRLLPANINFNFINFRKISYALSIILSIASILYINFYRFNFGIDFAGGISMEVRSDQIPNLRQMRTALGQLNIGEVMLQNFGSEYDLSIRVGSSKEEN